MPTRNDQDSAAFFVLPDQLRIGLYVHLDIPWFRHSFMRNSFRITSARQIVELQALGESRFRFDPACSEAVNETLPGLGVVPTTLAPHADGSGAGETASALTPLDHAMSEKKARIERLAEQRTAIDRIEKSFAKASAVMRSLNKNLFSRPKETLDEMGGMVDQMVNVFLESPEVTLQVLSGKSGGEEIYYHGLNVAVLCLMLAKALGLEPAQARLLGIGALLHDIGLSEIPDRVLMKPLSDYTKSERELRALHVEYGVARGQRLGLQPTVLAIIGQHHELVDGSGYPKGLKQEQIAPLARIVSLVNFYDNLCNPIAVADALTPHEALSFMFAQRRAKFDAQVLQVLVHSLGVYPPGSIVKLSNDEIAMVVSVNPKKSLRPWVLVYDPGVPKEEAIMLDLEMEPTLSIRQAIRPALLLPPIHAYLCPHKRVTYFFDRKSSTERAFG